MPTGKVRFYDAEKGFGFLHDDDGNDVFVHANALPEGATALKPGTRVEFDVVDGRKGAQALHVRLLQAPASVVNNKRKKPEEMVVILEDVIKLLDGVSESLRRGHYPDKRKSSQIATLLRAVATDLDA